MEFTSITIIILTALAIGAVVFAGYKQKQLECLSDICHAAIDGATGAGQTDPYQPDELADKVKWFVHAFEAQSRKLATATESVIAWKETARQDAKNSEYYRGLLDQIAENFGEQAYASDDGSVQDSPLRAKMPELVKSLNELCANRGVEISDLERCVAEEKSDRVEAEHNYRLLTNELEQAKARIKKLETPVDAKATPKFVPEMAKKKPAPKSAPKAKKSK